MTKGSCRYKTIVHAILDLVYHLFRPFYLVKISSMTKKFNSVDKVNESKLSIPSLIGCEVLLRGSGDGVIETILN